MREGLVAIPPRKLLTGHINAESHAVRTTFTVSIVPQPDCVSARISEVEVSGSMATAVLAMKSDLATAE